MKFYFIAITMLLTSCSQNYYIPVTSTNSATVSFSNLSSEIPDLNIITNCERKKINNKYIERKKPTKLSKYTLSIPTDKAISFQYNYFWISGEYNYLATTGNPYQTQIKSETRKEIQTCNEIITFKPEANKHYEIYFGKELNNCIIKVSEAYYDKIKNKKSLYAIKQLDNNQCK